MKSQFITLYFFFFFLLVSSSFTAPDSLWTRMFGGVYDENGFSVQQTSYGDNVQHERIISKSDSKGKVRHLSESNIFNDRKSRATVNKLIFNTGFLLIEALTYNWDNTNWVIVSKYKNTYDVNNNLIEELYQFWVGENWVIGGKYRLTYDVNNNLIEWLYEYWDSQYWVNYMMRTFSYITITGIEPLLDEVNTYNISNNYPDPFNPSTTIEFNLPKATNVRIEIFNIAGQKISTLLNKKMPAGSHQVEFNAQNLSSGIYYYRIEAGEFQDVKKMVLIK